MSDENELTAFPAGPGLRATDWAVEGGDDQIVEALTDRFGPPSTTTSCGVRWESTRWLGVYRIAIVFDRDGSLAYRTTMAEWAIGGQLLVYIILAAFQWVPGLSMPWSVPTDLKAAVVTLLATVVTIAILSRIFRGPTFDPGSLGLQVSRTGVAYIWLHDALLVFGAATLGATIGAPLMGGHTSVTIVSTAVFVLLILITRYAGEGGWLILYYLDTSDGWLTSTGGFTGQFKVGVIAAFPPVLALFAFVVTTVFVALEPSQTLPTLVLLQLTLTVVYCLLCLHVYRSYEGRRLDPHVSIGGRIFLLVGLLLINSATVILLMATSRLVATSFNPSLLYREIMLVPAGYLLAGGSTAGCLAFAALMNVGRIELRKRDDLSTMVARYGLAALSILTLATLFGLLSNVIGATVTALGFGNDALVDATPQTVRTTWEGYLRYTSILPEWGYGLFRGIISIVEWLPIVFLAIIWGTAIDRRIAHRLRLAFAPQREFDADALPGPSTVTVVPGTTAYATGGLLTPSRIVIGDQLFNALTEDQLAAIIAHERHHVENRDVLTASLASVAGVALGGTNILLAFIDLAQREYEADLTACRAVSGDDLRNAVVQLHLLSDEDGRSSSAPGFVLGGDFALGAKTTEPGTKHAERPATDGRVRWLLGGFRETLRAPQELLFGDLFFELAHPTLDVRLQHIELREQAIAYVAAESTHHVTYPQEQRVTMPVPRERLLARLTREDIDRSFAERVVDSLVIDGELTETPTGLLPGWDNATA